MPYLLLSLLLLLLPDFLQCLAELAFAQGFCQFTLADGAADPPDIETFKRRTNFSGTLVAAFQLFLPPHSSQFASISSIAS
jgi:hypothetical protein